MIALLAAATLAAGPQPAPFQVTSVGLDLRTVTIALRGRALPAGRSTAYRRVNLRLRRPIRGRRITGAPRISGQPEGLRRRRAPRVLDMSAADAERALAAQGFRSRASAGRAAPSPSRARSRAGGHAPSP